ncbi:alpha/beta fold hydrolase [Sabulicella glaciei]|uniref:Alpha/beta hydrolase n=1 Tax=Sabulicella glaciei TaxID=2984948 RepID=A0ABT3NVV4_9PROT|nr:alpha/beta hydrolase [Roseococcus sp. MDT2-1-1]MCW8086018.1 alpha/beta hydrolase [Roseococcus sp. MDT2-1-1]
MTPVVALHGIGGSAGLWAEVARDLPLLAWDQPGYGGTALPPVLNFPALADALVAFLDAHGIAQADLTGHSMGGMIALEAALLHPARVRRLALIATTPAFGGRDPRFAEQFLHARLAPLDAGRSMAECAGELLEGLFGPEATPAMRAAAARAMGEVPEATYRATLRCLSTFDRREALPQLTQPTLLVAGNADATAPERTMRRMADALPDARLVALPTGHMPHLEAPAALAAALREFFEG